MAVEFTIPLEEFLLHVPRRWTVENVSLIDEISTSLKVVQRLRESIEDGECSKAFPGLASHCIRHLKCDVDSDFFDVFVIGSHRVQERTSSSEPRNWNAPKLLENSFRTADAGTSSGWSCLTIPSNSCTATERAVVVKCEPVRFTDETANFLAVPFGLHSTRLRQWSYSSGEPKLSFFSKRTGGLMGMEMQSETTLLHSRMLPITIQNEIKPLNMLTTAGDLAEALKAIFESYRCLYETAKIIHRDISLNNLMFRTDGDNIYGVLRESDATLPLTALPSLSKRRTGTKLFIAIDLLAPNPPVHLYRHDLESFLYVLVFLTCQIKGSKLAQWDYLEMEVLQSMKHSMFTWREFPPPHANFQGLNDWILAITELFMNGFHARTLNESRKKRIIPVQDFIGESFIDETLGDHVTFDKFAAILQTPIIPQP